MTTATISAAALWTDGISCEQVFSRRSLGYLWSKRDKLDPGQCAILNALYMGRKKGVVEGHMTVEYRLPRTGVGKLGFGRVYGTKGSLETLERECRGTMCREFYDDIDVVNCHPVLLHQLAQNRYQTEMPEVLAYCENRKEYLERIHADKDEAKMAILKVFYNGKNDYAFLAPMVTEIRSFTDRFLKKDEEYAELLVYVRKQDANTNGAFLSHILQTEERRVMMAMRESFMSQGFKVDVLAYDGVMIRKGIKELSEEHLHNAENHILATTQYRVKLMNKAFEYYDIPNEQHEETEEIAPKVIKADYERKKVMFEENNFYYLPTNSILSWDGKQISQYSVEQATIRFVEYDFKHGANNILDRTSFIKIWINDFTRRTINEINMKPSEDPMVFSPPLQFRFQTFPVVENVKAVETFKELIQVVCNRHKETYEYVMAWFAHMFQRPFENPKTAMFLTGQKGCGKDTTGDFIIEWLMGRIYAHNYESTEQFWDKYDTSRENRFFIKIEEVEGAINRKNASAFKARITSETVDVNPKNDKKRTSAHYCRYFGTTNEPQPWKTEKDERRAFIIPCSSEWVKKHDKWTEIRETLFNAEGASAVGNWLMGYSIESWDARKIPETEYMALSADVEITAEQSFLDAWDGEKCSMIELYQLYRAHCLEHSLIGASSSKGFGMRLLEYLRNGLLSKERKMDGFHYWKTIP
jgi:hypothetical protein